MKHNLPLGVTLILLACLLYSSLTAILKMQADILPPLPVVVFLQNLVSLLLILPIIYKNGHKSAKKFLSTNRLKLHLLRSVFSILISYSLYYSLKFIPLVNAMLLSNAAPLIVPFVGYIFFTEKINHRLWLPVLIGYAGVALVLNPNSHIFNPGALLAFSSAVALAFTIQCVRTLTATESITTITFYFLLFSTLFSGIISIPFWEPITISALFIMFMIGFLYFTSQYIANGAMKFANPQLVSSLMYSNVIYAALFTLLLWNTFPSISTLAGMLLIIVGGISCIRVEHTTLLRAAKKQQEKLQYSSF